ncbi:MAG: 4Fe-4S dicluster domain-containing protein [Proteobacteria bacterium]|nr:4Fe-4S dicluster domain-containing protein [Pseudomonadota bacterium]
MKANKKGKLKAQDLNLLFSSLQKAGFDLIGPKLTDNCITYDHIQTAQDLPQGWSDFQEKGTYRLKKRNDNAYFGYNIGNRSFKEFLFVAKEKSYQISKQGDVQTLSIDNIKKMAFIGVRSCELHAIHIQDKVFIQGQYINEHYKQRRQKAFIVALNCHTAANTCFCVSMNTGPEVTLAYDLNLSEIINENEHYFILEAGSIKGQEIFDTLPMDELTPNEFDAKKNMLAHTASHMGRKMNTLNIKEKLYAAHDSDHWNEVAQRCINCANCTLACPTCFCSREEVVSDLAKQNATHIKHWDTCFSQEYSAVHQTPVRSSAQSRYRQWITHKLASWYDQFDTSGCVGCGRCITWCPVGIDITEEYTALTRGDE